MISILPTGIRKHFYVSVWAGKIMYFVILTENCLAKWKLWIFFLKLKSMVSGIKHTDFKSILFVCSGDSFVVCFVFFWNMRLHLFLWQNELHSFAEDAAWTVFCWRLRNLLEQMLSVIDCVLTKLTHKLIWQVIGHHWRENCHPVQEQTQGVCLLSSKLFLVSEVLIQTLNYTYICNTAISLHYRCRRWSVSGSHMRWQLSHFHF